MLNKEQIMEILPHRPPMLLVDEIVEMDEEHVIGLLHLTGDEFFFQGHFLEIRSCRRCSVWKRSRRRAASLCLHARVQEGKTAVYTGIDKASSAPWPSLAIRCALKCTSPSAAARWP